MRFFYYKIQKISSKNFCCLALVYFQVSNYYTNKYERNSGIIYEDFVA